MICIFLLAVLTEVGFLDRLFGKEPTKGSLLPRSVAVGAVTLVSALLTCPILLLFSALGISLPTVAVLIPILLLLCTLMAVFKSRIALIRRVEADAFLPITAGCVLLGISVLTMGGNSALDLLRVAFVACLCYFVVTALCASVRMRLSAARIPWFLHGLPIALLALALILLIVGEELPLW